MCSGQEPEYSSTLNEIITNHWDSFHMIHRLVCWDSSSYIPHYFCILKYVCETSYKLQASYKLANIYSWRLNLKDLKQYYGTSKKIKVCQNQVVKNYKFWGITKPRFINFENISAHHHRIWPPWSLMSKCM